MAQAQTNLQDSLLELYRNCSRSYLGVARDYSGGVSSGYQVKPDGYTNEVGAA